MQGCNLKIYRPYNLGGAPGAPHGSAVWPPYGFHLEALSGECGVFCRGIAVLRLLVRFFENCQTI